MINLIAFNGENFWLDDRLQEYEEQEVTVHFIVYNQLLRQLHLPTEKWHYLKHANGRILVEKNAELLQMNEVIFKELDYSKLVSPLRLYAYYLLQEFLGNGLNFKGLGLVFERKARLMYLHTDFDLYRCQHCDFSTNDISHFVVKRAKWDDLMQVHETFFVLMDQHIKGKLMIELTRYQAETGLTVEKKDFINTLFDPERLKVLKSFSQKIIDRS